MRVDPLLRKCECGYSWHFNKFHYMWMILFNRFVYTCPRCQRKHHFKLICHAVEEYAETRNENNEMLMSKREVWKNG